MVKYTLLIKPDNEEIKALYENHTTYHDGDSGLDLFCSKQMCVESGKVVFHGLGIRCEMIKHTKSGDRPSSYYMYPRSSISKTSLLLANSVGIIDAGYRGELIAAFRCVADTYTIQPGERLVQICSPTLEPFNVKIVDALSDTKRGDGGFGSTGK